MAMAHLGIDSLIKYLKKGFAWQEDWQCEMLNRKFTYLEIKRALLKIKELEPDHFKLLVTKIFSSKTRNEIASYPNEIDPSTFKRRIDNLCSMVIHLLTNDFLIEGFKAEEVPLDNTPLESEEDDE